MYGLEEQATRSTTIAQRSDTQKRNQAINLSKTNLEAEEAVHAIFHRVCHSSFHIVFAFAFCVLQKATITSEVVQGTGCCFPIDRYLSWCCVVKPTRSLSMQMK
jgi:uncharacterized membrane protein YagU involved in acid resistance